MSEAPLIEAAKSGDVAAVQARLSAGDSIEQKTSAGDNALAWAVCNSHAAVVRVLLDAGSDPNATLSGNEKMPQFAQKKGNAEIISLINDALARAAGPSEKWQPMGADSVAFVGIYPHINRKMTHLFNFASRERLIISENTQTKAETITQPTLFDDLSPGTAEKALEEFEKLGGKTDRGRALYGQTGVGKPAMKLPGLGGGHG